MMNRTIQDTTDRAVGTEASTPTPRLSRAARVTGQGAAGALALTAVAGGAQAASTGATEGTSTHGTEGGHLQWTVPEDWEVSEEQAGPGDPETYGMEAERFVLDNPEGTAQFTADTGNGPTGNDGAKADVVDVVDAVQLSPDTSEATVDGQEGEVWYRAAILEDTGPEGTDPRFEDGDNYRLAVEVVTVPEGTDPTAADAEFYDSIAYTLPAVEGHEAGTTNFLTGTISQSDAEEITGKEGVEALEDVIGSPDYTELRDVATSLDADLAGN